ncbi:MAG: flavin reductase [Oscillospiraceae bacterium]|jgi:flavorubredoxin/flavin reductase (DIM6/NTAB) family NADH-FMN oxidoreductase RutF|nr:flavin reductase [Oscillospiraceae bacterium]
MFNIKNVTDDLIWVGANDRRLAMFEGVYSVPNGVSYNSYILLDEKTVLFDTVDKAVHQRFIENVIAALDGKDLDYFIIQHTEPDHTAAVQDIVTRYPNATVVCNAKTFEMIKRFFNIDLKERVQIVKENDTLKTGRHELHFLMAPMVHWPEVMVTYDSTDKILFSADAFGSFGALNGALFADEVNFDRDYMDEARRYYTNIVGKYGNQVMSLLNKASTVDIEIICPLHGFVWRRNLNDLISKYVLWGSYIPEEQGVMIAYASVYGNTENAAEILSSKLRDKGIKTQMFDTSVIPASEIISAAFRWSHLVFASTTYNAGIFITMEALVSDIVAHNLQNRTVAIIENGSWAATSGGLIRERLSKCKNMNILDNVLSIKSSLQEDQISELEAMVDALIANMNPNEIAKTKPVTGVADLSNDNTSKIDKSAMFKLSYGLFILTAKDGDKDNGCIVNTVTQVTDKPLQITVAVNKANYTCEMIQKTKEFNVSILDESAPFKVFEHFGFHSGRDTDKFADCDANTRTDNGIRYMPKYTSGILSAKVSEILDFGSHLLFVASITEAFPMSKIPSMTYQYYFDNVKPKPQPNEKKIKGYRCIVCGYIYEGDPLPADFICPWCKHGAEDFEKI